MLAWMYEPILQHIQEEAEREGNTEILQLSESEQKDILKTVLQDLEIIREEKELEKKKIRCERLAESVKNLIDGFYDSEWDRRAIDFVLTFCNKCLVTFTVEFDIPMYFYIEMLEIGEGKVVIDSLINAVVAEYDADIILEFSLNEAFMDELFDEIISRAKDQRVCGSLNVVERYKNEEYTVDIVN